MTRPSSSSEAISATPKAPRVAAILAAGKGTRMRSDLPKVLHSVAGRPMLHWVIEAARQGGCERILVIIGHGADAVRQASADLAEELGVSWVLQEQQLGTGHALAQIEPHFEGAGTVLVLSGDVPLVRPSTLDRLAEAAETSGWGSMAVADLEEPGALGRALVPADDPHHLDRIVEARDANPKELACRRVNAGLYALPAPSIFDYLRQLDTRNDQGELYLTDALGAAVADGHRVRLVELDDFTEAFGINTRRDLARVHRALIDRHLDALMDSGVTILEPARTTIEPSVCVGIDTVIHPEVTLVGNTRIGADCTLGQGSWVRDSTVGDTVRIEPYSLLDQARVAEQCTVGPFARLRPASVLQSGARVGNFVELKKTELGPGSKASHLTYLGDTTVGAGANIGAGVVTCNYDGVNKHTTNIGAGAFVGSDSMLVAPVTVGAGATTGAGSVITHDVPDEALAVGRARQRNIADWARKSRKPSKDSKS